MLEYCSNSFHFVCLFFILRLGPTNLLVQASISSNILSSISAVSAKLLKGLELGKRSHFEKFFPFHLGINLSDLTKFEQTAVALSEHYVYMFKVCQHVFICTMTSSKSLKPCQSSLPLKSLTWISLAPKMLSQKFKKCWTAFFKLFQLSQRVDKLFHDLISPLMLHLLTYTFHCQLFLSPSWVCSFLSTLPPVFSKWFKMKRNMSHQVFNGISYWQAAYRWANKKSLALG